MMYRESEIASHGFTQNDHFYGTYTRQEKFIVHIGECQSVPATPIEEAVAAARHIHAHLPGPIVLCMSGGVDSECMALAFIKAQVPFRVAIQRFNDCLNLYDIDPAIRFCKAHNLHYELIEFDILNFYETGEHLAYARKYGCSSPQICVLLRLMEMIKGTPVMAWNLTAIQLIKGRVSPLFPDEPQFTYFKFFNFHARAGVPFFFLYSPELIFSFLRLPRMQDLLFQRGPNQGQVMSYALKCDLYRAGGFAVVNRENKYTGFEELKAYYSRRFGEDEWAYDRHFRFPLHEIQPPGSRRDLFFQMSTRYLRL